MRIELNSGGLASGAIIHEFQSNFDSLVSGSRKMVAAFQTIKSFTSNINGGIGSLQEAVDRISSRAQHDDSKSGVLESVQRKANSFVELARRIDLDVGGQVNRNKNEFYNVNPWSRPPQPKEEKKWYQKAWDHVCGTAGQIKDGINHLKDAAVRWGKTAADTLSKAWQNTVDWYKQNKDFINQVIIEVAIGAAVIGLAVLTGGTSLAVTVAIAAGTSAFIGGSVKGIEYYAKNGTLKGASKEIIGATAKGFMTGAIEGYILGGSKILMEGHKVGRAATSLIGSGTNGGSTFISETIHAASDGNGITADEWRNITISSFISAGTGGFKEFKGYKKTLDPSKAEAAVTLHANDKFVKEQTQIIKTEALQQMRNGKPGQIFEAQERIRDIKALNDVLSGQIIKRELTKSGLKITGKTISTGINAGLRSQLSQMVGTTISEKTKFIDIKLNVDGVGKSIEDTIKSTTKLWIKNLLTPTEVTAPGLQT